MELLGYRMLNKALVMHGLLLSSHLGGHEWLQSVQIGWLMLCLRIFSKACWMRAASMQFLGRVGLTSLFHDWWLMALLSDGFCIYHRPHALCHGMMGLTRHVLQLPAFGHQVIPLAVCQHRCVPSHTTEMGPYWLCEGHVAREGHGVSDNERGYPTAKTLCTTVSTSVYLHPSPKSSYLYSRRL